jgi:cytochrome c556
LQRINLFQLVELGENLSQASKIKKEDEPFDASLAVFSLERTLNSLRREEKIQFSVASHYIDDLLKATKKVHERSNEKDAEGNSFKDLGWSAQYQLKSKLDAFRTVLAAEFRSAATYYVAKIGIYSTENLIENASSRFVPHIAERLGNDALDQYQEAARCLVFGLHTACGFHMMRAVEHTLLLLMKKVCGKAFASLNANWGAYIAKLQQVESSKSRKKPKGETIDLLRQMKNNHRNPVMHAEISLSKEEAIDIFDLGGVVMSHLAEELIRLN